MLSHIHQRGTPAAAMENQIQNSVKNERTARLIELSDIMGDEFIERFKGRNMPVLFEREISENLYEGYTSNYIKGNSRKARRIFKIKYLM